MSGKDIFSPRAAVWTGAITLALLVFGFGGWSMLTHISGAIIAQGQLEVENNRQIVQHPDGGVVAEISVQEAQLVQAGDLLIRLDGSLLKSELAIVEGQLFEAMARRARLEAERDNKDSPNFQGEIIAIAQTNPDIAELIEGQRSLFFSRRDTIQRQTEQLEKRGAQIIAQIEGIVAQTTALDQQLILIDQELEAQKTLLAKGLAQSSRVSELERAAAGLQGNRGELIASRAQSEGRATEVEIEILRIAAQRREDASLELRNIGQSELELAERRRSLSERIARLEIRAPVSGQVLNLQVTSPRSVLRPADPVLFIIPQDRPLVIAAQIQPIHIDEVHIGQRTRLVFSGFSARSTPEIYGHVVTLSADAMIDQNSRQSFYRAQIVLDEGEIDKLAHETLLPGMPVQAFIETGARTPMAYLLKPFTDYFRTAFRET